MGVQSPSQCYCGLLENSSEKDTGKYITVYRQLYFCHFWDGQNISQYQGAEWHLRGMHYTSEPEWTINTKAIFSKDVKLNPLTHHMGKNQRFKGTQKWHPEEKLNWTLSQGTSVKDEEIKGLQKGHAPKTLK